MIKKVLAILSLVLVIFACSKVPVTGRRQMKLLPETTLINMSAEAYTDFLTTNPVVAATNQDAAMVERVGKRIAAATEKYLKDNRKGKRLKGFDWNFKLVNDPTINAWCMPGGRVVFYTGILPITKDENGLAVVMGHEIAHAIARHGNERMSQQIAIHGAGASFNAMMNERPEATRNIFLQSYGVASALGSLAYSRRHEAEADHMGLVFMALAGYDPREAPKFWERMSQLGGADVPEILRTHPSDEKRIKNINDKMSEAMYYYNMNKK
jgi:predicted Zn-dependent protease